MAKANLTTKAQITTSVRELDFVTRFGRNWDALRDIMGIMRPIKKDPGTKLVSYKASIVLQDGDVGEGESVPYSKAKVEPVAYDDLTLEKYKKAVSVEAVAKYGAAVAVQRTDEAFLNQLQSKIMDRFYAFLATGSMTATYTTFQMAIAMAIGKVKDRFEGADLDVTQINVWVNTLDAYEYLGAANVSVQSQFGIDYIENFMGAQKMFLSSKISRGKVIATPSENIVNYYIDPGDADFTQLGLDFTVDGETNYIGFHTEGNYDTYVGENAALMGMALWAEYLDGVAVVYIGTPTAVTNAETITSTVGDALLFKTAHSPLYSVQELKDGSTAITDYTIERDGVRLASAPTGTVTIKYTYIA